ncbi:MAG: B12-binding domain-containing radical SAM protein [Myxococcales bacterium]|nr:B12-binding domain-containing radical SAM protein [Myxococcales bacterium]
MADFVLVNPPLSPEARYGKLAPVGNRLPNLGLAYLAAFLRAQGVDVAILDAAALGLDTTAAAARVAAQAPLVCGLTATTLGIRAAAELAAKIKQLSPDCVTVLGGPHVSSRPEETIESYRSIDYGVVGEGEATAWEIFREVERGGSPALVKGVVYRDGGMVRFAKRRPLFAHLDDLPQPAWDLLPPLAPTYGPSPQSTFRLPSTILFTSRGCPYKCAFCDRGVFGQKLRMHGAAYVWEMMELLYRQHSIVDFAFHDESLFIDEGRLVELCRAIQRSGLPLSFSCQARVDQIISPFALRELAKAGCWQVSFGLESGSDDMLRRLGKGTTVEQAREALRKVRAEGISTKAFIMLGAPGETADTLRATRDFVLGEPLDDVMIGFFAPFPGAELTNEIERHGRKIGGYQAMSEHQVSFVPTGLEASELEKFRRRLYRSFYLRRAVFRHYRRRLREPSSRRLLLRAAWQFLRHYAFSG